MQGRLLPINLQGTFAFMHTITHGEGTVGPAGSERTASRRPSSINPIGPSGADIVCGSWWPGNNNHCSGRCCKARQGSPWRLGEKESSASTSTHGMNGLLFDSN
mmetsp:Transcript_51590/g.85716  ORF Transcript_51590/g.85716 Transcript_51590/m.85716 type:complete len:104 (+) Transcript_51590:1165-1476(+)